MLTCQVRCRLSRRQRRLYDEYMMSAETRSTLAGGNFMGIISCLMQLRKVIHSCTLAKYDTMDAPHSVVIGQQTLC